MQSVSLYQDTGAALVCFSHLRWNFVYQRPQHLLSRAAKMMPTFFIEEPIFDAQDASLETISTPSGVIVLVPHLRAHESIEAIEYEQRHLLDTFLEDQSFSDLTFWYYTPMALGFSGHIEPDYCVYDCMDELSAFRFAPAELLPREKKLLERCDVVFTGGFSLYEAKRNFHPNVHCFPSSVDQKHFAQGRNAPKETEPPDQAEIPHPRVGFFGVIDERMDLELVSALAHFAPDLQIVMIGPVAKLSPADLPRHPNLHWLGPKRYDDLPAYLAGWHCGFMPFALNESTRFISPTKTPEFLAAGLPLVSTRIADVVRPYGDLGLVIIADDAVQFIEAIKGALAQRDHRDHVAKAGKFLADKSWDRTLAQMFAVIEQDRQAARSAIARSERKNGSAI